MAITVDWAGTDANPFRIYVPKADTTLVQASPEVRELDADVFRKALKDLEAAAEGMPWTDTHDHAGERVLAGVTYGRFVEVLSPYSVEFENGQYGVTVVGANTNLLDVKIANQVSLLGNNSAGLVNLNNVLNLLNYGGAVWIDTISGSPGTIVGTNGTQGNPVDNAADAVTVANSLGIRSLRLITGAVTLTAALEDFEFVMDINGTLAAGGQSLNGSVIRGGMLTGTMTGAIDARATTLVDLHGFQGIAGECGVDGTLTLAGPFDLVDCFSKVEGTSTPVLDFNGVVGAAGACRRYAGGWRVRNVSDATNIATLSFVHGQLTIEATCSAGQLVVRGPVGPLNDLSTGSDVNIAGRWDPADISLTRKLVDNRLEVDFTAQRLVLYDDDGTTVLKQWDLATEGGENVTTSTGIQTKRTPV